MKIKQSYILLWSFCALASFLQGYVSLYRRTQWAWRQKSHRPIFGVECWWTAKCEATVWLVSKINEVKICWLYVRQNSGSVYIWHDCTRWKHEAIDRFQKFKKFFAEIPDFTKDMMIIIYASELVYLYCQQLERVNRHLIKIVVD